MISECTSDDAHRPKASYLPDVVIYRSITHIEPDLWDSICAPYGLSCTHRFIKTLEESRIEEADYWFVLISLEKVLIGAAALSSFTVSIDLLNPGLQGIAKGVRHLFPGFLKVRMLFCGLPISIGKHTLCSKHRSFDSLVVDGVATAMKNIAFEQKIRILCAKEFLSTDIDRVNRFQSHGFFRAPSIPRIGLPVRWPDVATYMSDLRSDYRRQLKANVRKIGRTFAELEHSARDLGKTDFPRLRLLSPTPSLAATFASLYAQVMDRVEFKLEMLDGNYFRRMFEALADDLELIVLQHQDNILGAALIAEVGGTLHFLFVGLDYSFRDDYDSYFNLLHGIVAVAIERKCAFVDLGQTSYRPKLRIGGVPEEVCFYLRATSPIIHTTLKSLRSCLFPRTRLPQLRVFRRDHSEYGSHHEIIKCGSAHGES